METVPLQQLLVATCKQQRRRWLLRGACCRGKAPPEPVPALPEAAAARALAAGERP